MVDGCEDLVGVLVHPTDDTEIVGVHSEEDPLLHSQESTGQEVVLAAVVQEEKGGGGGIFETGCLLFITPVPVPELILLLP